MAVHTQLSQAEVARLCAFFELGPPGTWRGLAEGSINTNYELTTPKGRFFLTLREGKTRGEVEDEVALLAHLSGARFPAPRPLAGASGPIGEAHERPVLCFPWLAGEELAAGAITAEHMLELGRHLGRMHVLLAALPFDRPNPYGPDTIAAWLASLAGVEHAELRGLLPELERELSWCRQHRDPSLPRGPVHCDLFVDNVKWIGGRVAAFFDFEMACRDAWNLDLAITLNAWTFGDADYERPRVRGLVAGYQSERRLGDDERAGLFAEARFGALRYTVSRIRDFELSRLPPERLLRKDFRRYLARLRRLRELGPAGFADLCGL